MVDLVVVLTSSHLCRITFNLISPRDPCVWGRVWRWLSGGVGGGITWQQRVGQGQRGRLQGGKRLGGEKQKAVSSAKKSQKDFDQ